jgi:hypothetical protein
MAHKRSVLDIPIFHLTYSLYKLLDKYRVHIPKAKRYTLWLKTENTALNVLEGIIATSHHSGEKRLDTLHQISIQLDMLKVFIRLALEIKCLDSKHYLEIQKVLQEIGQMLGGWIKFASR